MKLIVAVLIVAAGEMAVSGLLAADHMLAGLDSWEDAAIKAGAAAAALGGAWRWLVGPGYRGLKRAWHWTRERLELIAQIDERLDVIDQRLEDGEAHFQSIDELLATMAGESAREVRAAIREHRHVRLAPDGSVDRRA